MQGCPPAHISHVRVGALVLEQTVDYLRSVKLDGVVQGCHDAFVTRVGVKTPIRQQEVDDGVVAPDGGDEYLVGLGEGGVLGLERQNDLDNVGMPSLAGVEEGGVVTHVGAAQLVGILSDSPHQAFEVTPFTNLVQRRDAHLQKKKNKQRKEKKLKDGPSL